MIALETVCRMPNFFEIFPIVITDVGEIVCVDISVRCADVESKLSIQQAD